MRSLPVFSRGRVQKCCINSSGALQCRPWEVNEGRVLSLELMCSICLHITALAIDLRRVLLLLYLRWRHMLHITSGTTKFTRQYDSGSPNHSDEIVERFLGERLILQGLFT